MQNGWTDRDAVWVEDLDGLKESCRPIRWGPYSLWEKGNFKGAKGRPVVSKLIATLPWAVQKPRNRSRCRLWFGLGWAKGSRWGAHWRHLANITEPSMCGGDAACCQITMTTCYVFPLLLYGGIKMMAMVIGVRSIWSTVYGICVWGRFSVSRSPVHCAKRVQQHGSIKHFDQFCRQQEATSATAVVAAYTRWPKTNSLCNSCQTA